MVETKELRKMEVSDNIRGSYISTLLAIESMENKIYSVRDRALGDAARLFIKDILSDNMDDIIDSIKNIQNNVKNQMDEVQVEYNRVCQLLNGLIQKVDKNCKSDVNAVDAMCEHMDAMTEYLDELNTLAQDIINHEI